MLITGIGIAATTYHLTKALQRNKYDLVINTGICGSAYDHLQPVHVVRVKSDYFGDSGVGVGKQFNDLFDLGLMNSKKFPFRNKKLTPVYQTKLKSLRGIPEVNAVTFNKITGTAGERKKLVERFGSFVESLEGAAFFYVCMLEKTKCIQLRAVSNMVGERNKKKWKINQAVDALEGVTGLLLMELETGLQLKRP